MTFKDHVVKLTFPVDEWRMTSEKNKGTVVFPIQSACRDKVMDAKPGMAEEMPSAIRTLRRKENARIALSRKIPFAFFHIGIIEGIPRSTLQREEG